MHRGMTLLLLSLLILSAGAALAQESQKDVQASPSGEAQVPPDTPVITLNGFCGNDLVTDSVASLQSRSATSTPEKGFDRDCKTVITRQQYEDLLTAIGGRPKPNSPPKFAKQYIDLLLLAENARRTGGEKDPAVQAKLRYNYLQGLNQFALIYMQRQADDITDADTEKYFQEHPDRFVRMHLEQIVVPKQKSHDDEATPHPADPAEQEEMHALALKLQKEAAAGGNVDKIEEKAYKAAHDVSVPATDAGNPVPEEIPSEYRKLVFDLKPGQVSAVTENDHEYLIFKCVEKHTEPQAERKKLYGWLRMRDSIHALHDMVQTELNGQYFSIPPKYGEGAASSEKTP